MNHKKIKNNSIFDEKESNKDDLIDNMLESKKAKAVNEKSTNLTDNDETTNNYKSHQGI